MPGRKNPLRCSSIFWANFDIVSPNLGMLSMICFDSLLNLMNGSPVSILLRYAERAPTFREMDILLSFRTTMRSFPSWPAWLRPSKASPAVIAPSPMTAITLNFSPSRSLASIMPVAAEMEVELWPVPKASYGLSSILGNPERPLCCLRVENCPYRPVRSLWAYA